MKAEKKSSVPCSSAVPSKLVECRPRLDVSVSVLANCWVKFGFVFFKNECVFKFGSD